MLKYFHRFFIGIFAGILALPNYINRDPCLFPQVIMEEYDGNEKGVEEEGEEEADEDDHVHV